MSELVNKVAYTELFGSLLFEIGSQSGGPSVLLTKRHVTLFSFP